MAKRGRWASQPELLAERSKLGVARAADLQSLEMHSKTVYARCLPGGPWRRLLPGIILLHDTEPTEDQRIAAALLYAGPDTVLSGSAACRRYGLRAAALPPSADLQILIPHHRKMRSAEFVTVERTHRLPSPILQDGVPLAPLVRATTDTARRMCETKACEELLIEAIQRGRCRPESLLSELNQGAPRGTALPRRLLSKWTDIRSIAESTARRLSMQLTSPPSHWNVALCDAAGRYVGRPDAWWDDVGLAWEIDSYAFHFSRQDYARTLARNTRYAGAGITVVQTLPDRLSADPAGILAELDAAYRAASARPRPLIRRAEDAT
ncbi:hypothetical protein [Amycolatopsis sp. NBC_01480]|uniref:hypothetical protein n=1 Tax=Amycolatopsis sp. NBC_01480 TaxID=2903562 RepID=UPI002E2E42A2|nr:hypothetical protein [Amycolatopsis sp. NBC_01480]